MKKLLSRILASVLILITAAALTACAQWANPYEQYDEEGNYLTVRYISNGGTFNSDSTAISDVIPIDGVTSVKLIPPESPLRDKSQCTVSHKSDYRFAGWYIAEAVADGEGNLLDKDGNPIAESGKEPAYKAGARWNFETDSITVEAGKDYSAKEPVLTLMAMWIPKFTFEFYFVNGEGEPELIGTKDSITVNLPKWSNGRMNLMDVPEVSGMTFEAAYADAELTEAITSSGVSGEIDYDKGVAKESTVRIYTTWREGTWFRIETPDQLISNAKADGCYNIIADLDMSGEMWPTVFSQRTFSGCFEGNGHTVSGIHASQIGSSAYKLQAYGIFGTIASKARFSDISFSDVSFTVSGAMNTCAFGLLSADIQAGATMENVSLSGKLLLAPQLFTGFGATLDRFSIGLVTAGGYYNGIEADVTWEHQNPEDPAASSVTVTLKTDGTLSIVLSEDGN